MLSDAELIKRIQDALGTQETGEALIEKAYAEERIDDTKGMVTFSLQEGDWAELMEMIDY